MIQLPLPARLSDPIGSHEAEKRITESGTRARQADSVLEALRLHNGSTSRELAKSTGLDRYVIGRRLSELEIAGLVRAVSPSFCERRPWREVDEGIRECAVEKLKALRWWIA